MAENQVSYKKLPGRTAGFLFGRHRLWYSDDHLIQVSSMYASERYQRFYFRDIGAFIVRRTKTRLIWNILFGVLAAAGVGAPLLAFIGWGMKMPSDTNTQVGLLAFVVPGVFALIAFLINTAKGAGCSVWVQTAGGTTRLDTPVRVPVARKVINTLSPLIVQAQAERPVSSSVAP